MNQNSIDSGQFKKQQQKAWNKMAKGWEKWWPLFEEYGSDISKTMIEKAEIKVGDRILDIATGIGEPAFTASSRVGPEGYVLATDISEEMVTIAKNRIAEAGLTNIKVLQSDVAKMDLKKEEPFNAVLCRLGIMLIPGLDEVCTKIYESLKKEGLFVATVFSEPARAPIVGHAAMTIQSVLKNPERSRNAPGIFSLADPTLLTKSLKEAGFSTVQTETLSHSFIFKDAYQFRDFTKDTTPPINLTVKDVSEEVVKTIWEKVAETAKIKFTRDDGKLEVVNDIIYIIAKK